MGSEQTGGRLFWYNGSAVTLQEDVLNLFAKPGSPSWDVSAEGVWRITGTLSDVLMRQRCSPDAIRAGEAIYFSEHTPHSAEPLWYGLRQAIACHMVHRGVDASFVNVPRLKEWLSREPSKQDAVPYRVLKTIAPALLEEWSQD